MEPTLAEIRIFAGNFAPRGWALCEGQLLSIAQNQALFSILGTTYGGDGRTTFGLPDLRGRTAMGEGNGPGLSNKNLGQKSGSETNTLTINNLASHSHTHTLTVSGGIQVGGRGSEDDPAGNYIGSSPGAFRSNAGSGLLAGANGIMMTPTVLNQGGQQPVNNMQPFLAIYYIIALQGLFPSRS